MAEVIEKKVAAAFGVAENPGVYAVLLGSGVSRAAGIPTGWEIVLDLVRRLAELENSDPGDDLAAWYKSRFGEAPQYSEILTNLAPEPAERRSLLQKYFEPVTEEDDEKTKLPTPAHQAIARLVAGGWVRVIVTTNFDKLMELALEAEDIAPVVISTPDQALGAIPLAHCPCVVIKVHGDYLDPRIKNSTEELESFEAPIDAMLDQVFDEYGLIVCGWSGEYDAALRRAIERSKSRRFTTFWCAIRPPGPEAKALIIHTRAQEVRIANADEFFAGLHESVAGIRDSGRSHPLESRAAIETLKRYLTHEEHRIRLREMVQDATVNLVEQLTSDGFPVQGNFSEEEYLDRIRKIEAQSERNLAFMANGCFWGKPDHDDAWIDLVRRLADFDTPRSGLAAYIAILRLPALLCMYAGGIAAVAKGRYGLLGSLLLAPCRWSDHLGPKKVIVGSIYPHAVLGHGGQSLLPSIPGRQYRFPESEYLHRALRAPFSGLLPAEYEYTAAFDRFEYLANLISQDEIGHFFSDGMFLVRNSSSISSVPRLIAQEIEEQRGEWPPIRAGLFGGSLDRLQEALISVGELVRQNRW